MESIDKVQTFTESLWEFEGQQKIDSSPQRISREEPITQPSIIGNGNKEVNQRGHESSNGPSILAQTIMKRQDSDSEQEESQDWEGNQFKVNLSERKISKLSL